jgi:hypothetical protein
MMNSISIESYKKGWEPVRLESYFADVLRGDVRLRQFYPQEQSQAELTASDKIANVAGVVSRFRAFFLIYGSRQRASR